MRFGEAGLLKFKELLNSTGQRQAVSVGGNFIWTLQITINLNYFITFQDNKAEHISNKIGHA